MSLKCDVSCAKIADCAPYCCLNAEVRKFACCAQLDSVDLRIESPNGGLPFVVFHIGNKSFHALNVFFKEPEREITGVA